MRDDGPGVAAETRIDPLVPGPTERYDNAPRIVCRVFMNLKRLVCSTRSCSLSKWMGIEFIEDNGDITSGAGDIK
jgi:hypothetical protein